MANPVQAANSYASYGTFNGEGPAGGPRAISVPLTFTAQQSVILVDFLIAHTADQLEGIQGIFADNSLNPNPLIITSPILNQNLTWPPNSQGFLPVFAVTPPTFTVNGGSFIGTVQVIFTTFAVPADIWQVSNANLGSPPGIQTTGSAVYTGQGTAGTSAAVLGAAQALATGLTLSNNGSVKIYVGNSSVTTATGKSIAVGGTLSIPCTNVNQVYVISGTAGQAYDWLGV